MTKTSRTEFAAGFAPGYAPEIGPERRRDRFPMRFADYPTHGMAFEAGRPALTGRARVNGPGDMVGELAAYGREESRESDLARARPDWQIVDRQIDLMIRDMAGDSRLPDYELHVLGDRSGLLLDALELVAPVVRAVTVSSWPQRVLGRAGRSDLVPAAAVICIDCIDMCQAVDLLRAFRLRHPRVPVLIASLGFREDDFSTERATIADASVRLPAEPETMIWGLVAAIENRSRRLHAA